MLKKFKKFLERISEIRLSTLIIVFVSITLLVSITVFLITNVFHTYSEEDYDILESKVTNMISAKDFKKYDDINIKSCNLNLMSDVLTLEASYNDASVVAKATNYSGEDSYISFQHLTGSNSFSIYAVVFTCLTIGVIVSILIIFALHIIIFILKNILQLAEK